MIGNPYPQHQNVQEWNDFVNEVRNVLTRTERNMEELKARVLAGEGEYDFPEASEEEKGIMKLYQTIGDNDDGAISQAGIKAILQDYVLTTALDTTLRNYVLSTTLATTLQNYAQKTMLNSYYTKEEMDAKLSELSELFATDEDIRAILNQILPEGGLDGTGIRAILNRILPETGVNEMNQNPVEPFATDEDIMTVLNQTLPEDGIGEIDTDPTEQFADDSDVTTVLDQTMPENGIPM